MLRTAAEEPPTSVRHPGRERETEREFGEGESRVSFPAVRRPTPAKFPNFHVDEL